MDLMSANATRLLAVEDDPTLGAFVRDRLGAAGLSVTWCQNGGEGLELALREPFDLVLLDVLLPGMNGLEVLARLRQRSRTPVLLMSALGEEQDRIDGFRGGADDYLPKPFSLDELQVRVEAILRRVELERGVPAPTAMPVELRFDDVAQDVHYLDRPAGLTPCEYRLLGTLHRHVDDVLSKAFLYQHVLQRGYSRHDRSLDMHVSQIRRKLKGLSYLGHELRTVWGKGYMFATAVTA
ncbi:response regulator transcription factor [Pseudomonas japonica]|uniref:response regulator transcription factor n=1 Tax=Pseudomonas japonica TaxID=256466 RepID=UPI0015E439B0|nr:response regulator transcription factor [Pseudomonas japonica]MBA1289026.1 response regulator transcription factor [Pseudomonas japonica]